MAFQDDGAAAVRATQTARQLSPIDPFSYYYDSLGATAYLAAGDWGHALELAERSLGSNDRHISTWRAKITAQHFLGQHDAACASALELKRRHPDFKIDSYRRTHPAVDFKFGHRVIEALEASGIT